MWRQHNPSGHRSSIKATQGTHAEFRAGQVPSLRGHFRMVPPSCRPFSELLVATVCLVWLLFGEDQAKCKPHGQGDEPGASGSLSEYVGAGFPFIRKLQPKPLQIQTLASALGHIHELGEDSPFGENAGGAEGSLGPCFREPLPTDSGMHPANVLQPAADCRLRGKVSVGRI